MRGPGAIVFDCGVAAEDEFLVVGFEGGIGAVVFGAVDSEALDEDAVEVVVLHPAEVAVDGFGMEGGEDVGGGFVAVFEGGWGIFPLR